MAERPVFVPSTSSTELVYVMPVEFQWFPGFARIQKERSIESLHAAAAERGVGSILEISSKSKRDLGRELSAFNLGWELGDGRVIPLECAFQGAKVFEHGGPFTDLFAASPRDAKRDQRLTGSGELTHFEFEGRCFELEPKTFFYDWLYLNCIHREHRFETLNHYDGFTDIEFNPKKSINCQARSAATYVALGRYGRLDWALERPENLKKLLEPALRPVSPGQGDLFSDRELR